MQLVEVITKMTLQGADWRFRLKLRVGFRLELPPIFASHVTVVTAAIANHE
jgi:hypothetical protein